MLSPLDLELLETWEAQQIPFEVIARGIRRAAETTLWDARPGENTLRSLRSCRRQVEAELKKHLQRSVQTDAPPTVFLKDENSEAALIQKRHRKLIASLQKIAERDEQLRKGIDLLLTLVQQQPPTSMRHMERHEEWVFIRLLRSLPFSLRLELLKEAIELTKTTASVSVYAKKLSRRFHRAFVLRRRFSLPAFW